MKKLFKEKVSEVIYTKSKNRQCCQPLRLLRFGLSVLLLALVFIQSSCKKEDCDNPRNPECSNYDACIDAVETDADFGFYIERTSSVLGKIFIPQLDTIYGLSSISSFTITFKANSSQMSDYEWTIGSDPRVFNDSIFQLTFENVPSYYEIKAKLRVRNSTSSNACYPTDTGESEFEKIIVYKRVYFGPDPSTLNEIDSLRELYLPIYGKFHGSYDDDQNDTCTINIISRNGGIQLFAIPSCAEDLPVPCLGTTSFFSQNSFTRRSHVLECRGTYYSLGMIDKGDHDKLEVLIYDYNSSALLRTWHGKRIK